MLENSIITFESVFPYLLVYVRIGMALMFMPAFGDPTVNPRIRLLLGLGIATIIAPIVWDKLPLAPSQPYLFLMYVVGEILIGAFIGLILRVFMSTLDIAATIFGSTTSLHNAFVLNPSQGGQTAVFSTFLSILVALLIFATDTHHLMLGAIAKSYQIFVPGSLPAYADLTLGFKGVFINVLLATFALAVQLAAPFIVVSILLFIALGLLNRLMPQMHVFFISQPFQIFLGFLILSMVLGAQVTTFLEQFQTFVAELWNPMHYHE